MFSLQKIAVLIGIISAVWAAFRFIGQFQKAQQERAKVAKQESRKQRKKQPDSKAVELSACKKCGAFVPGGVHVC